MQTVIYTLATIGSLAVLWALGRWIRLVLFRTRTLFILANDLAYKPAVPGFQAPTFNAVTRDARDRALNEHDAAIAFMLVQLGSLSRPLDAKARAFSSEKLELIDQIVGKSTIGKDLIMQFLRPDPKP